MGTKAVADPGEAPSLIFRPVAALQFPNGNGGLLVD